MLYRIECIKAFGNISVGDLGGFVESYDNLYENAWVYENATVTKKVITSNFIYDITLTDNHIKYGCEQKTIEEWDSILGILKEK